ncbi:MAG TPA: hypothetical protein VF559_01030 [Caulobacteraceae bacterium]|jgi:hypothetical protein
MPDPNEERPHSRETEYEDVKPAGDGQAPRSATEPEGAEGSSNNSKTATDPASGEQDAPMARQTGDAGPQELRDEVPKTG